MSETFLRARDGVPIEFDGRTKVEDMSDGRWRLTIDDANNADAGVISCVATNEVGKDECSASLRIQRNLFDSQYFRLANALFSWTGQAQA